MTALLWALSAPALAHTAHVTHHAKKTVVRHGHHATVAKLKAVHVHARKAAHHIAAAHHLGHHSHARTHLARLSPPRKMAAPSEPGDHSAEDLNARSLDAAQSGQAYSPTTP